MGEVLPFPAALEGLEESPWKKELSAPEKKKLEVFKCERPLRPEQWESSVHTHYLKQIPGFGGKPQAFPLPRARTWNGICLVIVMRRGRKPAFLSVCIKLGLWSFFFFNFQRKSLCGCTGSRMPFQSVPHTPAPQGGLGSGRKLHSRREKGTPAVCSPGQ